MACAVCGFMQGYNAPSGGLCMWTDQQAYCAFESANGETSCPLANRDRGLEASETGLKMCGEFRVPVTTVSYACFISEKRKVM